MQRFKVFTRMLTLVLAVALVAAPAGAAQRIATPATQTAAATQRTALVQAVVAVNMTVSDLDRSVKFYTQVLTFQKTGERADMLTEGATTLKARTAELQLGDECITLTQYSKVGRPIPPDSRSNDLWFQHIAIIVSNMDRAYAILQSNHVARISPAPQRLPDWNAKAGGIKAFYFKDPDGHPLEILSFPAGKGDPKWHRATNNIFLGIDHTAIAVSDTAASLRFYRDLLGMHVAGESENYGADQERLNNVDGAHLRITSLHAESGPGIELLEYLTPRTGRLLPQTPSIIDLVHRHTELAGDPIALRKATSNHKNAAHVVPTSITSHNDTNVIHDPDGHELAIRGK